MNTHPEQWAAMLQRPGSSWGFGALLKDTSVVVLKEDTPPHQQSLPDLRFEPTTLRLQVRLAIHQATTAPVVA